MRSATDKKISSPGEGGRSSDSNLLFRNNNNLDDLPEVLLVEILCRLPSNKLVFQCKCVCKRWFTLICGSYFVGRYLWLQRELQKPILSTLCIFGIKWKETISAVYDSPYLVTTSDHPVFETLASNLTLTFLPCYHQDKESELAREERFDMCLEPGQSMVPPVVVGWYKDLLLCCATRCDQRHYYLCNPYTKQWAALPPTPGVYNKVYVSFFYDPYFNHSDDAHEEKRISTSTGTRTSCFILDAEYAWKVVRLVPNSSNPNFHVEMFSSETREWRELVVLYSQPFSSFCTFYYTLVSSVAYNGMSYWWCNDSLIFDLDLSTSDSTITKCRFIELPEGPGDIGIGILGVSGGRLWLCKHSEYLPESHEDGQDAFRVWELKQVVKDNQGKFKWLVDRVSITWTDIGEFHPHRILVLGFHPSNEDTMYFKYFDEYLACKFRGGILKKVAYICSLELRDHYRYYFMLPWWPTPVPNL
ncbi:hypothetical protein M0R45_037245 [Rubus argutus]|uniref:F-box domain-containing protein n=1 Tax=Rubus argutus TaxID=59490 RepID=A0AAW1W120_RUBAR